MDHLNNPTPNANGRVTPGYNRNTFFPAVREEPLKGGRDEEPANDAWDVYADFNNAGPRYSTTAYVAQNSQGYIYIRRAGTALPPTTPKYEDSPKPGGTVELVTVPAMGAEWGREELKEMTKSARRERKAESRREFWKQWYRGERGMCGRYFTRKVFVFFMFGLIAATAIVVAFTIPRVPSFSFNNNTPLANATSPFADTVPTTFSRVPTNFSFPAFASLQLDTNSNFLPLHSSRSKRRKTVPAKSFPEILLPLNFTYIASNDSDQTWLNWYNGCKNRILYADGIRPAVKFRLVLDMNILGLPTHHTTATQVSDADCPIELSINSV
ncbi:hypothetical protein BDQ17DRAFT_1389814 [Cyathus striatus]|nr:hypothetical protein BDQ17DRAFT_1389814 [Cyathus striatus]